MSSQEKVKQARRNEVVGKVYPTRDEGHSFTITDYVDRQNVSIRFDTGEEKKVTMGSITRGICSPGYRKGKPTGVKEYITPEYQEKLRSEWEGKTLPTSDGSTTFTIKKYINSSNVIINFEDSNVDFTRDLVGIQRGVKSPFIGDVQDYAKAPNPIAFTDPAKKYLGSTYYTHDVQDAIKNGTVKEPIDPRCIMKVVEYKNNTEVTVEFQDPEHCRKTTKMVHIKKGSVLNPAKLK